MVLPAVTRFGLAPLRLPDGGLLLDLRDDGRAYGMYDHAMELEYEEDEQGQPAVDELGRRVVAGDDPWAAVRNVTRDLRRWVNALQLAPGRVLYAYFDLLYDEGDDFEVAVNDGRLGGSRHAKRLRGRPPSGYERNGKRIVEEKDERKDKGKSTTAKQLREGKYKGKAEGKAV